jgi:hypothetical protein
MGLPLIDRAQTSSAVVRLQPLKLRRALGEVSSPRRRADSDQGRDRIQWSGWWRYGNKQMVGTLYFNGRWRYDEKARRNGRVETTINTVCHEDKNGL